MALGVAEVLVGVAHAPGGLSGCTVVLPPAGTVGSVAVRGQAPGTREAAAFGPLTSIQHVHGVVLSGGSAFGLATADGVMRWLEQRGVGVRVPGGRIPVVGGAIILDEAACQPEVRPDAATGWAACAAASDHDPEGAVGAGTGARVAKVAGAPSMRAGGQGIAVRRHGELAVGALVVNNAVGEVVDHDGSMLVGVDAGPDVSRWPWDPNAIIRGRADLASNPTDPDAPFAVTGAPGEGSEDDAIAWDRANTVVACVVTNARIDKVATHRMADLAHDGIVRAVTPAHTSMDGDVVFGLATGTVEASIDLVTTLAVEAVAAAARRGPRVAGGALAGHDGGRA